MNLPFTRTDQRWERTNVDDSICRERGGKPGDNTKQPQIRGSRKLTSFVWEDREQICGGRQLKREIDSRNVFSRETRRTTDAAFSVSASRSQQRGLEEEGFVILTLPNGRRELTTFLDSQTFKLLCSLYRVAARAD